MSMEDHLINLKMSTKQLERLSKKELKAEQKEKKDIASCLKVGNRDGAGIHAENSIRHKSMAQYYLRLSARVDAVADRVQSAVALNQMTASMAGVVRSMDQCFKQMDLGKITEMLDKFETQFEELDVRGQTIDNKVQATVATQMPQGQVDDLLQMVADENNLELESEVGDISRDPNKPKVNNLDESNQQDLEQRLAALRAGDDS